MLGAVSLRLGQEKVRDQFAPSGGAVGASAAPPSPPSVERLVNVILSTPSTKEAT